MMSPAPALLTALLLTLNVRAAAATGPTDGSAAPTIPPDPAMPGSELDAPAGFDHLVAGSA